MGSFLQCVGTWFYRLHLQFANEAEGKDTYLDNILELSLSAVTLPELFSVKP